LKECSVLQKSPREDAPDKDSTSEVAGPPADTPEGDTNPMQSTTPPPAVSEPDAHQEGDVPNGPTTSTGAQTPDSESPHSTKGSELAQNQATSGIPPADEVA